MKINRALFRRFFSLFPNLFLRNTNIGVNVRKGSYVKIHSRYLLANVSIDNYSYIAPNSSIRNTTIGRYCSIGEYFMCGLAIHPTNGISTSPLFYSNLNQLGKTLVKESCIDEYKSVKIGNDVFIGANVIVLSGVNIGDGAVIAAGAVVVHDVPPYAIVGGVPAKIIKYRFSKEIIDHLVKIRWWDWPDVKHQEIVDSFFNVEGFVKRNKIESGE